GRRLPAVADAAAVRVLVVEVGAALGELAGEAGAQQAAHGGDGGAAVADRGIEAGIGAEAELRRVGAGTGAVVLDHAGEDADVEVDVLPLEGVLVDAEHDRADVDVAFALDGRHARGGFDLGAGDLGLRGGDGDAEGRHEEVLGVEPAARPAA